MRVVRARDHHVAREAEQTMHLRHTRAVAAVVALSVTTPALLALAFSPASAGTSSGSITCTNPAGTPAGTPDAPFKLSFTATPPANAQPTGISFTGGKFALDATHTTGRLASPVLGAKPAVDITNYNATAGTADDISFVFSGVTF